jgi:hypothetical protein
MHWQFHISRTWRHGRPHRYYAIIASTVGPHRRTPRVVATTLLHFDRNAAIRAAAALIGALA